MKSHHKAVMWIVSSVVMLQAPMAIADQDAPPWVHEDKYSWQQKQS